MDKLSGFDFAKRVRNVTETEETPMLFCSALSGEDFVVKGQLLIFWLSYVLYVFRYKIIPHAKRRQALPEQLYKPEITNF